MRLDESWRGRIAAGNETVPRKHARQEAVPYQHRQPQQDAESDVTISQAACCGKFGKGVRREAGMAKRGAHRRQDGLLKKLQAVLLHKRRIHADVLSGLGCSCFELHSE